MVVAEEGSMAPTASSTGEQKQLSAADEAKLRSPELTAEEFARVVSQRTSRVSFAVAFVG